MSNGRKSWLVVLAVACVALALAVPAFATIGGAGYLTYSTMGGTNGTSPHGGYSTTTQKCVVCHAVHGANAAPGEVLLADSVANACIYCHVNSTSAYKQVYNSVAGNYSGTDYNNAHNSWTVGAVTYGVKCTNCHQVHAADNMMTANAYLTTNLLVGGKTYTGTNYDPIAQAPLSTDSSNTALTKWCTSCHAASFPPAGGYTYYDNALGGRTHILTTATAAFASPGATYNGKVAWANSNYCSSCHASQFTTSPWPHYTAGVRFLVTSANASSAAVAATQTHQDGICLRCHRDGTGTLGIGLGF